MNNETKKCFGCEKQYIPKEDNGGILVNSEGLCQDCYELNEEEYRASIGFGRTYDE